MPKQKKRYKEVRTAGANILNAAPVPRSIEQLKKDLDAFQSGRAIRSTKAAIKAATNDILKIAQRLADSGDYNYAHAKGDEVRDRLGEIIQTIECLEKLLDYKEDNALFAATFTAIYYEYNRTHKLPTTDTYSQSEFSQYAQRFCKDLETFKTICVNAAVPDGTGRKMSDGNSGLVYAIGHLHEICKKHQVPISSANNSPFLKLIQAVMRYLMPSQLVEADAYRRSAQRVIYGTHSSTQAQAVIREHQAILSRTARND
jgi:hypothetical protein